MPSSPAPATGATTPSRGRRATAAVTVLLLVLAVVATAGFLQHRSTAHDERQLAAAEGTLSRAATDLDGTVAAAQQVLRSSQDRVQDEALRTALADALAAADALDTAPEPDGTRAERARSARDRAAGADRAAAAVRAAADAVATDSAQWSLAEAADGWAAARDTLAAAVAAAGRERDAHAPGTPGRAAVDAALATALPRAVAARDAVVDPQDPDVLIAATTEALAARAELEAALGGAGAAGGSGG